MNFIENFWEQLRAGRMPQNFPNATPLNMGLAYTMQLPDRQTNLVWLPFEFTGLCYQNGGGGFSVNILPYYRGVIIEEFDISRGTDLHKPKTEEAFLKVLYDHSSELQNLLNSEKYRGIEGSAEDFISKMHAIAEWLRYYNSTKTIGSNR